MICILTPKQEKSTVGDGGDIGGPRWQRRWWCLHWSEDVALTATIGRGRRIHARQRSLTFDIVREVLLVLRVVYIMLDNDVDMRGRHAQVQLRKRRREEEAREVLLVLCVVVNLRLFIIMSKISYLLNYYYIMSVIMSCFSIWKYVFLSQRILRIHFFSFIN